MKKLFHLKYPNLNETNLTSSKAKTLNGRISVRIERKKWRSNNTLDRNQTQPCNFCSLRPFKRMESFRRSYSQKSLHDKTFAVWFAHSRRAELSIIWCQTVCALVQIQKAHLIKWKLKHELFHLIVNYFI